MDAIIVGKNIMPEVVMVPLVNMDTGSTCENSIIEGNQDTSPSIDPGSNNLSKHRQGFCNIT